MTGSEVGAAPTVTAPTGFSELPELPTSVDQPGALRSPLEQRSPTPADDARVSGLW